MTRCFAFPIDTLDEVPTRLAAACDAAATFRESQACRIWDGVLGEGEGEGEGGWPLMCSSKRTPLMITEEPVLEGNS